MSGFGFTECPDEHCDLIAEITEVYTLRSTDGPVRHMKTRCVMMHFFDMPENINWGTELPPNEEDG